MKFFYNGIKGTNGKLQKCSYGSGPWVNLPSDVITIYSKRYNELSSEVHAAFKVENGSDFQSDYFENDKIRVHSSHPLYAQVVEAFHKQNAHNKKKWAKRGVCRCFCGATHVYGECQNKIQLAVA